MSVCPVIAATENQMCVLSQVAYVLALLSEGR